MQFRDICAQSRKLSLNVLNFACFLHSKILRGRCPQKLYLRYHPHLAARHEAKSHEATPFGSKDPSSNTLHFKAIFDHPLKKVVRGAPVPGGGCTSKTWWFSSTCKNLGAQHPLGAEIWSSEKCALGGYDSTSKSPRSLDQTSPYLFCLTQEESPYAEWLSEFEYLHPFRRYSPPNFEVIRNRAKFCMFFAPEIFLGCAPQNFGPAL